MRKRVIPKNGWKRKAGALAGRRARYRHLCDREHAQEPGHGPDRGPSGGDGAKWPRLLDGDVQWKGLCLR